ncbi:MAG TPA: alpha/beta fold hydrolase, partial [Pyrinomonadaceae bacterium]|nr:alpha/beta fold hydrolase [Pyrinomonadaceae bacterium]
MRILLLLLLLLAPTVTFGQHQHTAVEARPAQLATGLGEVHHPVTTKSAEAQKFFDQGLAYVYAFNHEEAVRSFKRAAELDSSLAMARWGVALALGSNYNLQADAPQLKEAYANVREAQALAAKASERERAYIEALAKRYSDNPQADTQKLAADYKAAMNALVKRYPEDLDAATLYAESMMNLRPWKLWSPDGTPAEGTTEIVAVLESVLKRDPRHSGANHYYIHAVEASPTPERALPSAKVLERLAPAAGHLVHMPSHIYIRTGDYEDAARSNVAAIAADRAYFEKSGKGGVYPAMYYNHNIHFLASASAMTGRYADAIKAARELEASVSPYVKAMPMLEMFMPYTHVTLVRFQKWDEILKSSEPLRELKITTAFWRFARGMAYASRKQVAEAEAELKLLVETIREVPLDAPLGNSTARGVLAVAENLLAGRIAQARGDRKSAFELMGKAVAAEDAVSYNEPPDWDLPVREWLGGALIAAGDSREAEQVFRAELKKHPRNGRALFGLAESLKRQGKEVDARAAEREFEKAWAQADTKLTSKDLFGTESETARSTGGGAQGLRFADVQLKTGVRLRYAEAGDPKAPTLILLHGFTDSSFSYSRVMPALAAKYHVYALDQRGHGDSERPANGYSIPDFAADVVAFMDAKNLRRATVVGHSMGSFVAQQVAASAPERVERLVLIGSATTLHNDVVAELRNAIDELDDGPVPEEFVREFQTSTVHAPLPAEFMERVVAESRKVPARVWRGAVAGFFADEPGDRLVRIKAPTLIIWGDREMVFPRAEQDALVRQLSNAVLKVYAETGHSPQ